MSEYLDKWEERHFQIFKTLLAKHEVRYYDKEKKDEEIKKLLIINDIIISSLMKHEDERRREYKNFGKFI